MMNSWNSLLNVSYVPSPPVEVGETYDGANLKGNNQDFGSGNVKFETLISHDCFQVVNWDV